jgi:hypothetical protein
MIRDIEIIPQFTFVVPLLFFGAAMTALAIPSTDSAFAAFTLLATIFHDQNPCSS